MFRSAAAARRAPDDPSESDYSPDGRPRRQRSSEMAAQLLRLEDTLASLIARMDKKAGAGR